MATLDRAPTNDTSRTVLIGGALFIALLLLSAPVIAWRLRVTDLEAAQRMLGQLSVALAEQTARSFQAVDLVLQDTAYRLGDGARSAGGVSAEFVASESVHRLLQERLRTLPQADAITVVNADGVAVNTSRMFPALPVDVRDRDYFRIFADGKRDGAYVSEPVHSRVNDLWTVYLVRRLSLGTAAGPFSGLLLGVIALDEFERLFRAVFAEPGGAVTLIRGDGVILARYPHREDLIGQVMPANAEPHALRATHALANQDLAIAVSLTEDAALAGWRWQTGFLAAFALAVAACLASMLAVITRQFARQGAARASLAQRNAELEEARAGLERQTAALGESTAALRASERLLAERSATLNMTLENIDQGLLMVDANGIVAAYNHRAVEMLGLPEELLARRPAFREVLTYQLETDEFVRNSPNIVEFVRSGGMLDRPQTYVRERPDGRSIEVRSLPLPGGGIVRTYTDTTERTRAEARIQRSALFDELTGLANRVSLQNRLAELLLAWPGGEGVAVLYIDLDRFRLVNDARGHGVGDRLLVEAARRLRALAHPDDLVARTGGDEFAMVRKAGSGEEDGPALAARLVARLGETYVINGVPIGMTASIGLAAGEPGVDADRLLGRADLALYRAKDGGGNGFRRYEPAMADAQLERFRLEQALRAAIGTEAFKLAYQPVVALASNAVVGYEALLRWTDPVRGSVSPADFIPVAEATGLIVPIGRWVMETACREATGWPQGGTIAVNLSPVQFRHGDLLGVVTSCLEQTGIRPERLELEVTEGVLLEESSGALATMAALRRAGVVLTLDDFGTGHAGLSYLRRFPFQKIKIDRSFIRDLGKDAHSDGIVEAILLLGERLGLQVVAEGVETEMQLERLRGMGCKLVQGYLTGRPMSAEMARAL